MFNVGDKDENGNDRIDQYKRTQIYMDAWM